FRVDCAKAGTHNSRNLSEFRSQDCFPLPSLASLFAMASSKMVKVLEITRVTPSSDSPSSANEFSLPLSFFDIFLFKFHPIETVFFFQLTESTSTRSSFNSEILPTLKQSLSLALAHYLPLAGYLKWPSDSPKPILSYTPNDGISLTVAESEAQNFHSLSGNEIRKVNELQPLVPQLMISDDIAAILSAQITLFPNQGFSIGVTTHHAAVDGRIGVMFLKSWAYLCKQDNKANPPLPPELTPFFDRSVIEDPARLDLLYLKQWSAFTSSDSDPNKRSLKLWQEVRSTPDDLVRATFEFTRKDIKKLREKILSKLDNSKPLHLSTFVLTLAYTATCLVKAKGGEGDRPVSIVFVADCRTRLDPPLPITYFGNCLMSFGRSTNATHFMNEDGFPFAVDLCCDLIEGLKDGVLEGAEEKVSHIFTSKKPGLQFINVGGSPQLLIYSLDFGLGKLKKVEFVSVHRDEAIAMTESRDGSGGVEVGLALNKHEMENFASLFSDGLRSMD
ncbi:phenolic glucoside malonyltransferase 1-like, partial [Herrania umbratica]|uniref:Phenolic glucoside malonyltransferase 1-like n=1 Tax=Herrania umbratica TaxID=108875 RepID=A0A6J1BE27_9ROSI